MLSLHLDFERFSCHINSKMLLGEPRCNIVHVSILETMNYVGPVSKFKTLKKRMAWI